MTYHPQHHLEEPQCILRTADQHHGAKINQK